jgi:diguanylate cyclase (GGDEF)-like protein
VPLLQRDAHWAELSSLEGVQAVACMQADWLHQGLVHARRAAEAASVAGDRLAVAWADCRLAQVLMMLGEAGRATALFSQSEALAQAIGADDLLFSILHNRAWLVVDALMGGSKPKPEQMTHALQLLERAQGLADALANAHSQGICLLNRSRLLRGLGEEASSRQLAQAALELAHQHDLTQLQLGAHAVVVEWMLHDDLAADAMSCLQTLRKALPEADLIGHMDLLRLVVKAHRQLAAFEAALDAFEELHALTLRQAKSRADLQTWMALHLEDMELERSKARVAEARAERMEDLALQWEQEAHIDPLTGLGNRRATQAVLPDLLASAEKSQRPLMVAMLDLDHFKRINDQYGHDIGDLVLREVAQLLRSSIRPGDLAARLGGEEFLLLLPDTEMEPAKAVCERLRQAIADHPWSQFAEGLRVTVSQGLAEVCGLDAPWQLADQALYAAKANGRNQVVMA